MRIVWHFPQQLQAVLAIGLTGPCVDFYETVKLLPGTLTCNEIQKQLNISMSLPVSLAQPHIRIAIDDDTGEHLFIKLLRMPQSIADSDQSSADTKRDAAVLAEVCACKLICQSDIQALVKCQVVEVAVNKNVWAVLKMKRYVSTLGELPQLTEKWICRGFKQIRGALMEMHSKLNLVHMDVKPDNLFVDEHSEWHLGDFGSSRELGSPIWTFSKRLTPYLMSPAATVIPAMDFVQLCVSVAVELNKKDWISMCDGEEI